MLGQAHSPRRRLLGVSVAAFSVLALPSVSGADPSRSAAGLRTESTSLESRSRSAALGLYAIESQLASARARLAVLEAQAAKLRKERIALATELKVAKVGADISQRRLASRLRLLFDQGDTSVIEVFFGARSLDEALVDLDSFTRVTAINADVLAQLQNAKTRVTRISRALTLRSARLSAATRAQAETTRALEAARAERAAYIADLRRRLALNQAQVARIEAQVRTAGQKTARLVATTQRASGSASTATSLTATPARGKTLTVSAVAYSLPGYTASGLAVGLGVVAVDPSVIPLGTHMTVPGYGEAVAADTGTAIIGPIIDLWFPTLAQAQAWGRRTVTITFD